MASILFEYQLHHHYNISYRWLFISKHILIIHVNRPLSLLVALKCRCYIIRCNTFLHEFSHLVPASSVYDNWPTCYNCIYFTTELEELLYYLHWKIMYSNTYFSYVNHLASSFDNSYWEGGRAPINCIVSANILKDNLNFHPQCTVFNPKAQYQFNQYFLNTDLVYISDNDTKYVLCQFTLAEAAVWLTKSDLVPTTGIHGINLHAKTSREQVDNTLTDQMCDTCLQHVCLFEEIEDKPNQNKKYRAAHKVKTLKNKTPQEHIVDNSKLHIEQEKSHSFQVSDPNSDHKPPNSFNPTFPPPPLLNSQVKRIINGFCADSNPKALEEAGCAICGQLCCSTVL